MKLKVQLIIESDSGETEVVQEVAKLERHSLRPEAISTSLASPETLERIAERMEAELGEEQRQFIDGCQREWDTLPPPGPPFTVGLDGGFIHAKDQKSRDEGWFEVIAGKSMPESLP